MSAPDFMLASTAAKAIVSFTVVSIGMVVVAYVFPAGTTVPVLELPPPMAVADTVDPLDAVLDAVTERLKVEEGFRSTTYLDNLGNETIGYGTLLPLTDAERASLGDDRDLASAGITETEGESFLRGRLRADAEEFIGLWPPYGGQPFEVRVELVDAAYQLGAHGLRQFHAMLGFLAAGDYEAAADDVLQTLWAEQTPARTDSAAAVFRRVAAGV